MLSTAPTVVGYFALTHMCIHAGAKLLLLVRHGQAVSNWLGDTLGPDVWFDAETKCTYTNDNGTTYGVFDAGEPCIGIHDLQSQHVQCFTVCICHAACTQS